MPKENNRILFFQKITIFFKTCNNRKSNDWRRKYNWRCKKSLQDRKTTKKKKKFIPQLNTGIKDIIIRDIRDIFRLEKENKGIEDRILGDIRNIFEHKEEDYHKPVRAVKCRSNNYIDY